jgi:hypothetical protein
MLGGSDQAIPIGLNVFWGAADLGHDLGDLLGGNHFNGIPGADFEIVGIRLFAWDVDANFATDTAFQIDFAEALQVVELIVLLHLEDAVDRADLEAGFAASATIGVNNRQNLGDDLSRLSGQRRCCHFRFFPSFNSDIRSRDRHERKPRAGIG